MSRAGRRDLLDGHAALTREGQLGYTSGCGPRRVVVRCALSGGRLLFRLPEYSSALPYTHDQAVTLEVGLIDGSGRTHAGVVLTGTAQLVGGASGVDVEPDLDESWPAGVATHLVALVPSRVELLPVP